MKLTPETRPQIERLAKLTDAEIAEIALVAAEAAFKALLPYNVVIGASGDPSDLHMRAGRAIDSAFAEWGQRTLGNGEQFARNTGDDGKAGTAAEFEMSSGDAFLVHGERVGEGPRQYTGADFVELMVVDEQDACGYKYLDGAVGAASGAQGLIDVIPAATAARAVGSLVVLRDEAQALLAAETPDPRSEAMAELAAHDAVY